MAKRTKTSVNFNPKRFKGLLNDELSKNMGIAVVYLRDQVKLKLNRGQPTRTTPGGNIIGLNPSKPGEPPKKITAQLQNSIQGEVETTKNSISGSVGSNLDKSQHLEFGTSKMKPRPFLRPTLRENRQKIFEILTRGLSGIR